MITLKQLERSKTHDAESEPIVAELKTMGPHIQIKATGTPEEIFEKIVKELEPKLK